jgi:hypothetical protein
MDREGNGPLVSPTHTYPIGLCQACRHAAAITNASGSTFYRCGLSEADSRFPKYPPLPVIRCPGYQLKSAEI